MVDGPAEAKTSQIDGIQQLRTALHELCQPLTTLQCRLEMAQLVGTPEEYEEAVSQGLGECGRLSDKVSEMRAIVALIGDREGIGGIGGRSPNLRNI